jgi:predicted nucleic acid-binding protein
MFAFFSVDPGKFVETGNFACDLNFDGRGIEPRDPLYAATALERGLRKGTCSDAVRTDNSHAGNDSATY